jgi:hypothetical protein
VRYFFELCYWLMSLGDETLLKTGSKKAASKPASAKKQPNFDGFPMKEDALERLYGDARKFKVSFPDDFNYRLLIDGCGEAVCYIVNDLTNKELIRRKFQFNKPIYGEDPE